MSWPELLRAAGGDMTQVFPSTTAGKTDAGITSGAGGDGVWTGVTLVSCTSDGSLAITYADGTSCTKSFTEGLERAYPQGATITILSGTFDIA